MVEYSLVQFCLVQYNVGQYCGVKQFSCVMCGAVQYSAVLCGIKLFSAELCGAVQCHAAKCRWGSAVRCSALTDAMMDGLRIYRPQDRCPSRSNYWTNCNTLHGAALCIAQ